MASDNTGNSCLNGEQGVFRGLLSFRVNSGDTNLYSNFETAPKYYTIINPHIQNKITEAIGNVIGKKYSKLYSIKYI